MESILKATLAQIGEVEELEVITYDIPVKELNKRNQ